MQPDVTTLDEPIEEERPSPSRKRRRRWPISFVIGGLVILGAVVYLIYANTQANAMYYMTVSELHHCTICTTQSVRVAGTVQKGTVVHNGTQIRFVISDTNGQSLPVVYSGIVPDIFAPGIQVVVEGHYTGQGPFQAQTLLAKCPSKFTAATPTP
ncbi:MAG TPA: cytochrome c maturation protein CcmE [Ktedonobacteraceae bacterium]|nr:cytochrome c maturation protein CcmE [Ktedonobacteraceae bacterium]